MNLRRLPLFALALVVGGCSNPSTPTPSPTPPPSGSTDTKTPPTPGGTTPPPVTTPPTAENKTPKPQLSALTSNLKHDGFEYYGLSNVKPLKVTLTQGTVKRSGQQETELEEMKADVAVFRQWWTGDLAANGTSKVRVTPEGVFGIEAQGQELKPPQLEMPAKLTPGYTWTSNTPLKVNDETVQSTASKIIGIKTITVGGKPHSVLVISRSSKVVKGKQTKSLDSMEYYEKGVGPIKMDVKFSGGGEPTSSFTMEHTE